MLTENQLEAFSQVFYQRLQGVNSEYLQSIGTRLGELGRISPSDQTRLTRLLEWSLTDAAKLNKELAKAAALNEADVDNLLRKIAQDNYTFAEPFYKANAVPYVAFAENAALVGLVEGVVKETQGTLQNLTRTTSIQQIYKDVLDDAAIKANLGLESYSTAIRSTINEVAKRGIHYVDYESGYKRRLDTSVRQNILASMKSVNLRSAELVGQQFGSNGWEISYHSNPRVDHRAMGGRRYSEKDFEAYGIQGKLNEPNCYHYKYPIVMGVGSPAIDREELARLKALDRSTFEYNGKEMDRYEASQVMRRIETKIRQKKDVAVIAKASGDMNLRRQMQADINALNTQYTKISKASGLPTEKERLSVAGFYAVKTN